MKSFRKELLFTIPGRVGFVNITPQVEQSLRESGIKEELAPHEPVSQYRHNDTGEDNADAHLKRTVMGREVVVAITGGRLDFGTWEQIFYGKFDGRRAKRVLVKIIGE